MELAVGVDQALPAPLPVSGALLRRLRGGPEAEVDLSRAPSLSGRDGRPGPLSGPPPLGPGSATELSPLRLVRAPESGQLGPVAGPGLAECPLGGPCALHGSEQIGAHRDPGRLRRGGDGVPLGRGDADAGHGVGRVPGPLRR